MPIRKRYAPLAIVAAGTLALGAAAVAQTQGAGLWDPAQLPETKGVVKQYTLTPRGDVDGVLLADGTEVKFAPHLSAALVYAVRPGDAVTVRGLKARALPLVDGAAITNDATKATVEDSGRPDRGVETTASGVVSGLLHGKRGEVNGVVLDNGTMVRMPPHEAARLADLLAPGKTIVVRGERTANALGVVVAARALGATAAQLSPIDGPRGKPRGGPDDRGPPPPPGPADRDPPPRG